MSYVVYVIDLTYFLDDRSFWVVLLSNVMFIDIIKHANFHLYFLALHAIWEEKKKPKINTFTDASAFENLFLLEITTELLLFLFLLAFKMDLISWIYRKPIHTRSPHSFNWICLPIENLFLVSFVIFLRRE